MRKYILLATDTGNLGRFVAVPYIMRVASYFLGILIQVCFLTTDVKAVGCPPSQYFTVPSYDRNCEYRCRCINDVQCDSNTGECAEGCAPGWMGPACQYRNISPLYKAVTQSGTTSSAGAAVDGTMTTCSDTGVTNSLSSHWWRIEFHRNFYVVGLKITVPADYTDKIRKFQVKSESLDGTVARVCYQHPNEAGSRIMEVICTQPVNTSILMIQLDRTGVALNLCEVDIYGGRLVSFNKVTSSDPETHDPPLDKNYKWSREHAVDGLPLRNGMPSDSQTCFASGFVDSNPYWWQVDLGRPYTVQDVNVFARLTNASISAQTVHYTIWLGTSAGQFTPIFYDDPPKVYTPDLYQPRYSNLAIQMGADKVKLTRERGGDRFFFCEVEVFAECPEDLCGWECLIPCYCNALTTGTYKIDGTCPHGCKPGWKGDGSNCNTECGPGQYGANCLELCGYCSEGRVCDRFTGNCAGDCQAGYYGGRCDTDCPDGKYGINCIKTCSVNCRDHQPCDKKIGTCPGGCESGWKDSLCIQSCDGGTYGYDCNDTCGHCSGGEPCIATSGNCPGYCEAGFQLPLCQAECGDGSYGVNCRETCGACMGGSTCDKKSGICHGGCSPGWQATELCKQPCVNGNYGYNCSGTCGHCSEGATCNTTTGECPGDCDAGFLVPLCQKECNDGYYGVNCAETCGACKGGSACDKTNGICHGGCSPGWQATELCKQLCLDYTHGYNCSKTCGYCANNVTCDRQTGSCPDGGCQPGYVGPLCETECKDGLYGVNCAETCGKCMGDSACDKKNGTCHGGCNPGWVEEELCKQQAIQDDGNNGKETTPALIPAIIVGVVLIIVVTVAVVWWRRRAAGDSATQGHFGKLLSAALRPKSHRPDPTETADTHTIDTDFNSLTLLSTDGIKHTSSGHKKRAATGHTKPANSEYMNSADTGHMKSSDVVAVREVRTVYALALQDVSTLHSKYDNLPQGFQHEVKEAMKPGNKSKNRYRDMYTYDHNRVVLPIIDEQDTSDYINASFIQGYRTSNAYIASQGTMQNTIADMWRMIWHKDVRNVIMLTNCVEDGKTKCVQYWPESGKEVYGSISVTLRRETVCAEFTVRTFSCKLLTDDKPRTVTQFHYTAWPDKDVPYTELSLVQFWRKVKFSECASVTPWIVHCSAGVGRTGTFLALDYLYEQGKATGEVSIPACVEKLRDQRIKTVQTQHQYVFLYKAVPEVLDPIGSVCKMEQFREQLTDLRRNRDGPKTTKLHKEYKNTAADLKVASMTECEYANLSSLSDEYAVSSNPGNLEKCRTPHILPLDIFRVILPVEPPATSDFINAVRVSSYTQKNGIILTQFPMDNTAEDFVCMLWQYDLRVVVLMEDDIPKNGVYWPNNCTSSDVGPFTAEMIHEQTETSYTVRTIRYSRAGKTGSKDVTQFHFTSWPQGQAVPSDSSSVLQLLADVDAATRKGDPDKPIVIQCLNGADRSGLFCVLWTVLDRMKVEREVAIAETVRLLRSRRPQCIPSFEQYDYCHDVVNDYLDNFVEYANVM